MRCSHLACAMTPMRIVGSRARRYSRASVVLRLTLRRAMPRSVSGRLRRHRSRSPPRPPTNSGSMLAGTGAAATTGSPTRTAEPAYRPVRPTLTTTRTTRMRTRRRPNGKSWFTRSATHLASATLGVPAAGAADHVSELSQVLHVPSRRPADRRCQRDQRHLLGGQHAHAVVHCCSAHACRRHGVLVRSAPCWVTVRDANRHLGEPSAHLRLAQGARR
jgi:hypothetical protein